MLEARNISSNSKNRGKDKLIDLNETQNKVPFSVVEAYKNIRTNIITLSSFSHCKVLCFTSSNASEGKSTTSINISISISQLHKKVLLIDADARRPTLHKKLRLENNIGCMDVITGTATVEQAIQHYNNYMDILTVGVNVPNPTELYSSTEFEDFLVNVKEDYDYVIIDTPPINIVSDSLVIAQKADGVVLIIRSDVTKHSAFNETVSSLKMLNIKLIGVIINGVGSKSKKYYKYSTKKYGISKYE